MLRAIRRQLRLIGYYSAPRKRTRSSALFERAIIAALVLCIPAAFIVDRAMERAGSAMVVEGYLVKAPDGTYIATLKDSALGEQKPIFTRGAPMAGIELELGVWQHGWSVTSSRSQAPARVLFDRYDIGGDESKPLIDEPGVREAITLAMTEQGPRVWTSPFETGSFSWEQGPRDHLPIGWVYSSVAWFFLLTAAFFGPLVLYEFAGRVMDEFRRRRSVSRQQRGLCVFCGYNLMGSEFSARCPECGELVS